MILVAQIKQAVAQRYEVSREALDSFSRCRAHVRARQIAMSLACDLTRHSNSRVGDFFDRDHTTVLHARRRVATLAEEDAAIAKDLRELREELMA